MSDTKTYRVFLIKLSLLKYYTKIRKIIHKGVAYFKAPPLISSKVHRMLLF